MCAVIKNSIKEKKKKNYKDGIMTFYISNYLSLITEYEHNKEETKR